MTSPSPPAKQPYRSSLVPKEGPPNPNCWLSKVGNWLHRPRRPQGHPGLVFPNLPNLPEERREASLKETPLQLNRSDISAAEEKGKTVLYLAYGSNLCKETFRGVRGIKPLAQINVVVPSLRLTFDLPGIPYVEPCFANTAVRDSASATLREPPAKPADYHKDRWHKGLVGCVYEVTPSDYAHIIATEGGGSSYQDILVDCYPLLDSDTVPNTPTTSHFKAHTLFAPVGDPKTRHLANITGRFSRPDPSYAQPSTRYLKLITDGAAELSLPAEYQAYLNDIRTYTITSKRQKVGKALFVGLWLPFIQLVFALNAKFQDKEGRVPKWLATLTGLLFWGMWMSYDAAFKKAFGDGERTEGLDAGLQHSRQQPTQGEQRIGSDSKPRHTDGSHLV